MNDNEIRGAGASGVLINTPCCFSEQGRRPSQEDAYYPPLNGVTAPPSRVFLVCDGMGGHEQGEVASTCTASTIGRALAEVSLCTTAEMRGLFEKALQQAYSALDALDSATTLRRMGTTLTFLALCSDGVLVAHIGDSRVYHLRPGRGVLFRTRDHSLVNDLIAAGDLTAADARTYPHRNVITRAIQPHQDNPANASYNMLADIRAGDLFLLCSDGVVEQLDDDDLCRILLADQPLPQRLEALRTACLHRHTCDNNTAYLVEVHHADISSPVPPDASAPVRAPLSRPARHGLRLSVIGAIVLAVVLLAYLILFVLCDNMNTKSDDPPHAVRTTGTIRHHHI